MDNARAEAEDEHAHLMDARGLHKLAAAQQGLFTRDQARRLGASVYLVRQKVYTGEWVVVLGDVLAVAGLPLTRRIRENAALLHLPGTVLGGPTAARRHGLACPDNRIFVAGDTRRRAPAMVRVLRFPVPSADVVRLNGIPVTSLPRTVLDCLDVLRDEQATDLLDRATGGGYVARQQLSERVPERVGRKGTPRLVRLLKAAQREGVRSSGCPATCGASRSRTGSTGR